MKKLLFLSAVVLCMVSCNNTPTAYNELNQFEEISQYNDAPFSSQSQKTVCPMCGGTGVFEFMPGDIMAPRMVCPGCNGNGTVTPAQARAIMKAKAQAEILEKIEEKLTEQEKEIVKRGRNAENHHLPKNATVQEYMYSTGFEALIGYLYLTKQDERLKEILDFCIEKCDGK